MASSHLTSFTPGSDVGFTPSEAAKVVSRVSVTVFLNQVCEFYSGEARETPPPGGLRPCRIRTFVAGFAPGFRHLVEARRGVPPTSNPAPSLNASSTMVDSSSRRSVSGITTRGSVSESMTLGALPSSADSWGWA